MGNVNDVESKAPESAANELSRYDLDVEQWWTADSDGEAILQSAEKGVGSHDVIPAKTIIEVFELAVKKKGKTVAMRTEGLPMMKKGDKMPAATPISEWKSWTWKQYYNDCRAAAKAMIAMGVEQHDAVNIFGFNSPEWFIAQMSAIMAGGKSAGIYPSDNEEQLQFKSYHSNGAIMWCETDINLKKIRNIADDVPYLKVVVCWACDAGEDIERSDGTMIRTMTYDELLKEGKALPETDLDERIAMIKPSHCCSLIYTSGTTGRPKAVMISHDNLNFEAMSVLQYVPDVGMTKGEEERLISYLPLSHVAGMMVDIICPLIITAYKPGSMSSNFARAYDLKKGSLGDRLRMIEPTLFLGVPRVWEKIAEKLKAIGAQTKGIKKKLATAAKSKGLYLQQNRQIGGTGKKPPRYGIFEKVVLNKIKAKLGLGQCKFAFAGAAPMTKEILEYYGSLGINVNEVYGMSESTGAVTWSNDQCHLWGTIGFEMPGCEVKIFKSLDPEDLNAKEEAPRAKDIFHATEAEQGEICFRGRNVMMGYMCNPKLGADHVAEIEGKNAGAIDKDGWLHSGDKGTKDERGLVKITGRYKELIIGAGGENIAPVPIEDNIKSVAPFVSNVMMIGDKKKFNVLVVTLKVEGATGELTGTNVLDAEAAKLSKNSKTIEDAQNDPVFIEALANALSVTNANKEVVPSNAAKIQKVSILPADFSVEAGQLTATLKLIRSNVMSTYADHIDKMYESSDTFVKFDM